MFGAIASAFHQKWRVVGLSFGNQPFQGKKIGIKVAHQLHLPKSHRSVQFCALGTTFN